MRWQTLQADDGEPPALFGAGPVVRRFEAPQSRGMTFYEVRARSILNRVPPQSQMPFEWTVNPYRGCSHACVYCFARNTHTYLDLDAGRDFDSQVVVKVNADTLLRQELARPTWRREHVAMGTNVDCYQRAEGRYELMPGIIEALTAAANPFSILTKGTLILRDLELLKRAAEVTTVSVNVSVGFLDSKIWRSVEPGTPSPARRLDVCRTLTDAGIGCGVLMAPVLPYLTDSPAQLEATVRAVAAASARHITPMVLHLRPGAREWYFHWLQEQHPSLGPLYRKLYGRGWYAPRSYSDEVAARVRELARQVGLHCGGRTRAGITARSSRPVGAMPAHSQPLHSQPVQSEPVEGGQLSLL